MRTKVLTLVAVVLAAVAVPSGQVTGAPPAFGPVTVTITATTAVVTWTGGPDPAAGYLTVFELATPGRGTDTWLAPAGQRLDAAARRITLDVEVRPSGFTADLRLRSFLPGDPDSDVTSDAVDFAFPSTLATSDRFRVAGDTDLGGIGYWGDRTVPTAGWGVTRTSPTDLRFTTANYCSLGSAADPFGAAPTPIQLSLPDGLQYENPQSTAILHDDGPGGTGRFFLAYVMNRRDNGVPEQQNFQAIGLASSADGTNYVDHGVVISSPNEDRDPTVPGRHNYVGTPSLVRRGDHLYVFFLQDTRPATSLTHPAINDALPGLYAHAPGVARADLAEVRALQASPAATAAADLFAKYDGTGPDGFGAPGVGGPFKLITADGSGGQSTMNVVYNACRREFVMVMTTHDYTSFLFEGANAGPTAFMIATSRSGIDFTPHRLAVPPSLNQNDALGAVPELALTAGLFTDESDPQRVATATPTGAVMNLATFRVPALDGDGARVPVADVADVSRARLRRLTVVDAGSTTANCLAGGGLEVNVSPFVETYEGSTADSSAWVNISLSEPAPPGGVRVRYTTQPGTATPGADYTHSAAEVLFPAGTTTRVIRGFTVRPDSIVEPTEHFFVAVTSAHNDDTKEAVRTGVDRTRISILDEDSANAGGGPMISLTAGTAFEGDRPGDSANRLQGHIHLSAPLDRDLAVTVRITDGTAAMGRDFLGLGPARSRSFTYRVKGGATRLPFDITMIPNVDEQIDRSFSVSYEVVNAPAGLRQHAPYPARATFWIFDED